MNIAARFILTSVPIFTVCSYDRISVTVLISSLGATCLRDAPITTNNRSCGSFFWSASPNANNTNNAWGVNFNNGNVNNNKRNNEQSVRLVRGGE
jgi:hypothetical protein